MKSFFRRNRQATPNQEKAMPEMNQISEQKCRERAYELWEAAGAPEGREAEFWYKARDELIPPGARKQETNSDIDEAGMDSFPASDPVNRT
jgi:Protein of unknown function (DUF2934)